MLTECVFVEVGRGVRAEKGGQTACTRRKNAPSMVRPGPKAIATPLVGSASAAPFVGLVSRRRFSTNRMVGELMLP